MTSGLEKLIRRAEELTETEFVNAVSYVLRESIWALGRIAEFDCQVCATGAEAGDILKRMERFARSVHHGENPRPCGLTVGDEFLLVDREKRISCKKVIVKKKPPREKD